VRPDRAVLAATSEAFAEGADAASALPDATGRRGATDAIVGACFNHYFLVPAALLYRWGGFAPMAGGWLACRKEFLSRLGGLESLEDRAADDIAIAFEAKRLGAKAVLLPVLARIRERGGSPREAAAHLLKWSRIVRFCAPWSFRLSPLLSPVLVALAWAAWTLAAGAPPRGPLLALGAVCAWRAALARLQDRCTAAESFPPWLYLSLPALDAACALVWLWSFFSDELLWRGKTYRLKTGGRLELVSGGGLTRPARP
jgi:ceramide glucosyltransferase